MSGHIKEHMAHTGVNKDTDLVNEFSEITKNSGFQDKSFCNSSFNKVNMLKSMISIRKIAYLRDREKL